MDWVSHWDTDIGRSRRCGGDECALCARGLPRVRRWVLLVELLEGDLRWLELRDRHYAQVERIQVEGGGACGRQLVVWRKGHARNAPVEVRVQEESREVVYQDISAFVGTLGEVALLVRRKVQPEGLAREHG